MENIFANALKKIIDVLEKEQIDYMIVGGFAVSYHKYLCINNRHF